MLRTLEAFGFEWDGEVCIRAPGAPRIARRSTRSPPPAAPSRCSCSRKDLAGDDDDAGGYPGTCRDGPTETGPDRRCAFASATGLSTSTTCFSGPQHFDLRACGDVVMRAPRWTRELSARGRGRRRVPGGDPRGAWRRPARQHSLADRSAACARRCRRLSTDTCRCCWNRTAPNYPNPGVRCPLDLSAASRGPDFDPYVFVAGPAPGPGPLALLKMCGNGHLRTGTRKRLRARPRSGCPPEATRKQNRQVKIVGCRKVY